MIKRPTNTAEARTLGARMAEVGALIDSATSDFKLREAQIHTDAKNMIANVSPGNRETFAKAMAEETNIKLKQLRVNTAEKRQKHYDEAKEIRTAMSAVTEHLSSAITQAAMFGIGSERRARIEQTLQNSGPREVFNFSIQAELTGDRELAAAVISKNDSTDRQYRTVDSKALASKLFQADCDDVLLVSKHINLQADKAIRASKECAGEKVSPEEKILAGLNHRDLGPQRLSVPNPESKDAKPLSPEQKIAAGLGAD